VDEEESGGLPVLAETLLGYGQRHFEAPAAGQKNGRAGLWSAVLLMCGQFERVSAFSIELSR
jgi:nuclear pore complex protein Nup93